VVKTQRQLTQEQMLKDYHDVFSCLGTLPDVYYMEQDEKVPPVQNRPRQIALAMKPAVERKFQELEEKGVIARVDKPTEWISNLTAVCKNDKGQSESVFGCKRPQ